jgi:hypothetical protein
MALEQTWIFTTAVHLAEPTHFMTVQCASLEFALSMAAISEASSPLI